MPWRSAKAGLTSYCRNNLDRNIISAHSVKLFKFDFNLPCCTESRLRTEFLTPKFCND